MFTVEISWEKGTSIPAIFTILIGILLLLSLYTYLVTTLTEPGYLPRLGVIRETVDIPVEFLKHKQKIDELNRIYIESFSDPTNSIDMDAITDEYVLHVHDHPPGSRVFFSCYTCEIFRPSLSTSHCRDCDKCVRDFDHHCGFMGTCIGGRNRRQFMALLISTCLLCISCFSICLYNSYEFVNNYKSQYTLSLIEWIFISFFSGLFLFEIFFAPFILSFVYILHLLIIIGVVGLVTTVIVVFNDHLPRSSGIIGYLSILFAVFMAINFIAQIQLLRNGETVKKMIKRAVGTSTAVSPSVLDIPASRTSSSGGVSRTTTTGISRSPRASLNGSLPAGRLGETFSEDLYMSSEENFEAEDEKSLLSTINDHQPIKPMTYWEIFRYMLGGFLPSRVKSVYIESSSHDGCC